MYTIKIIGGTYPHEEIETIYSDELTPTPRATQYGYTILTADSVEELSDLVRDAIRNYNVQMYRGGFIGCNDESKIEKFIQDSNH